MIFAIFEMALFFVVLLNGEKLEVKFKNSIGKEIIRKSKHNMETINIGVNDPIRCASECLKKELCNNVILKEKNCTLFTSCQNTEYYGFSENFILMEKKIKCKKDYSNLMVKIIKDVNIDDPVLPTVLLDGFLAIGAEKDIQIWDSESLIFKKTLHIFENQISSMIVLHNGDLAVGLKNSNGKIKILDLKSGLIKKTLDGHSNDVLSLAVLLNGDLASGSNDGTVKIWNLEDGIEKKNFVLSQNVQLVEVLYNGNLVSVSGGKKVDIFNIENENIILTLDSFSNNILSLAVLHNDDLVTGLSDGSIQIWNLKTNMLEKMFIAHSNNILALVVLFNGDLASTSGDRKIKIWNLENNSNYTLIPNLKENSVLNLLNNGDLVSVSKNEIQIWT